MAIDPSAHFASSYQDARRRFLSAAESQGAQLSSHSISARSTRDEELAIDTAYLGARSPEEILVISSGLHGVEGFAGSAVQHYLLVEQLGSLCLEPGRGLLMLHALNPHGFSGVRRVNESNVDLNRNFVRHPHGHVANPGYEELFDAINPQTLEEATEARHRQQIIAFAERHGLPKLQEVLSVGQYVHPEGVQFGGRRPEESNRLLRAIAASETRGASKVVWIDLHTGLGPWGEVEIISESHPDAADCRRARAFWGARVRSTVSGESVSAAVHGSIEFGLAETLCDREVTAVAAEFGSYDPVRVFAAMRADNWLHQHGDLESEQGMAIKRELLEVFAPADPGWRVRVLELAAELMAQSTGS